MDKPSEVVSFLPLEAPLELKLIILIDPLASPNVPASLSLLAAALPTA